MLSALLDHTNRHDMMYCTCQMYLILPRILWVAEEQAHSRTLKTLLVLQKGRVFFVLFCFVFFTETFSSYLIVFTLKYKKNFKRTGQ